MVSTLGNRPRTENAPMPITSLYDERSPVVTGRSSQVPTAVIVAVVAAVAATWIAAGSVGLMAHPLRHALTWLAMTVAIVAAWPRKGRSSLDWIVLATALIAGLAMTASYLPVINILAVAVVLAALARLHSGITGRMILLVARASCVLAAFRLACSSIPVVWLAADVFGRVLGWLGGGMAGDPLSIGVTFAGVDFLVLMTALYVGWLASTSPPRLARAIYAAAAILAAHVVYLIVLALCDRIIAALPEMVLPPPSDKSRLGIWSLSNAVRSMLPWNLPLLAAILHATIVAVMFRWANWLPVVEPDPKEEPEDEEEEEVDGRTLAIDALLRFGPVILAVAFAVLTVLGLSRSSLKGKTVLADEQGYLDWERPRHDSEDAGRYGMLPLFVKSLGGEFVTSKELTEEELAKADVLVLLHPNRPWPEDRLQRVWEFVRRGGSLLVAAEPVLREGDRFSSFNEVLRPTAIRVRYDTCFPRIANWEHACTALAHPTTTGIGNLRNRFGLLASSSIRSRLPAAPLLVGRWAFSEPGSDAVSTGIGTYESGKRLGDLVLAAEQRFGKGKVVVLGDISCLHNEVIGSAYTFVGRLLGYLAGESNTPGAWWRQLLGLAAAVAMVALLSWRATPGRIALAAVALAAAVELCILTSHWATRVLPDGRDCSPNNVAYIDASHLEAYSSDTWDDNGIGGLTRTLVRNGYLPLLLNSPPPLLSELTDRRLERAGLLISIGSARPFSVGERVAVRKFIENGGAFICLAGAEEAAASRQLLADFGFHIPSANVPAADDSREAEPLGVGAFRQTFVNRGGIQAYMQTYAAWEVECGKKDAEPLMKWSDGKTDRIFVVTRRVGGGSFTVIGDTFFAVNKNLESATARIDENMNFWRWLLAALVAREEWIPPKAPDDTIAAGEAAEDGDSPASPGDVDAPTGDDASGGDQSGGDEMPPSEDTPNDEVSP